MDMVMSRAATDLPDDPNELRRVAGDLQRDVAALSAEVHAKALLIEKLKMQLAILRRARFGRSSEKLDRDIEQLELLIGDIEESDAEQQARIGASDISASSTTPKKPSVRRRCPIISRSKQSFTTRPASARPVAEPSSAGSAPTSARFSNMSLRTSSACGMCGRR
jgi:hypothetical protein